MHVQPATMPLAALSLLDGSIVAIYLVGCMAAGVMVRRYVGKVEHFLVAGREVNVFLGIASLAATEFGVVTCMYTAEGGYKYGFAGATPGILMALAMFVVGATGFCVKPLRAAGVITIPELLEKQYGPRIRWAAGAVIVLGGLLNMGVFLRITGEFVVLVCGLPNGAALHVPSLAIGGWHTPAFQLGYLELMMTVLLLLSTIYTVLGGLLSVLVTDFLQFIVMSCGLLAVTILILANPNIGWDRLASTVAEKYHDGGFNPFVNQDLGWQYVLFNAFLNLAAVLTWQTTISRLLAAKDPRTGQQIYTRTSFFFVCRFLIPGVWGIAALAMLAPAALGQLPPDKTTLHAMPLFLSTFVPVGLMGLLLAAMLAADMSTTSSYMLTWGSVIYNDIMAPFRKIPWPERRGLRWNRAIVLAIGLFLLVYGLWYPLKGDVWTYLGVTGTIYLASISTLLIACCYWKRANNWGAAAAIVVGAAIPVASLVIAHLRKDMSPRDANLWHWYSGIAAYVACGVAMIFGSLIKPKAKPRSPATLPAASGGQP